MTFEKWAKEYGAARLARKISVCRQAVYLWMWGTHKPNRSSRTKIKQISGYDFNWDKV